MTIVSILIVLALLVAANALYVVAEFGAVSTRRSRIRQLAEEGNRLARRLEPVLENPTRLDRYIAACQIGITISSLVLGAYGQAALAPLITPVLAAAGASAGLSAATGASLSAVLILIGLSVMQMVLGELVPKAFALEFPEKAALGTVLPLGWSLRLFRPLIWLLNGSGLAVVRLLGLQQEGHRHVHTPGEIDFLIRESAEGGAIEPEDRRRLRRALRLSSRRARDLMVPRDSIAAISITASEPEVAAAIAEVPFTRLPVFRDTLDDLVGFLHSKDVVPYLVRGEALPVTELVRPILTVPPQASADQLLVLFRERHAQLAAVGENGKVLGLVTLGDVLKELFGAMADEFEPRRRARGHLGRQRRDRQR